MASCLHLSRNADPQNSQGGGQLSADDLRNCNKYRLANFIGFLKDVITLIEPTESLCERKSIFRQVCRFCRKLALLDDLIETLCKHYQGPNLSTIFSC